MATNTNTNSDDSGPGMRNEAVRAFASEFNDSTYVFQLGVGEQEPKYTLLPTGARANRFFVIGVVTDVTVSPRDNGKFVQATINDGSGSISVSCSTQYNPSPAHTLNDDIEVPQIVSITGKAGHFGDDGQQITLEPESVSLATLDDRKAWVMETASKTRDRVSHYQDELPTAPEFDQLEDERELITKAEEMYNCEPYDYVVNALNVVSTVVETDD